MIVWTDIGELHTRDVDLFADRVQVKLVVCCRCYGLPLGQYQRSAGQRCLAELLAGWTVERGGTHTQPRSHRSKSLSRSTTSSAAFVLWNATSISG